jgi:hypothetical protein
MSELLKKIRVYDVECYPNLFMVTFYSYATEDYYTLSIFPEKNIDDRNIIIKCFLAPDVIWCGYNNLSYDDAMIHQLTMLCRHKDRVDEEYVVKNKLNWNREEPYFKIGKDWYKVYLDLNDKSLSAEELTKKLHEYSSSLMGGNTGKYLKKINIKSLDLSELIRKGFTTKSLKSVAVNLKHHRIQDLPLDPLVNVTINQYELMNDYNINDVIITKKILESLIKDIDLRAFLNDYYNNEVNLLSESDSGICKKLLTVFYQKKLRDRKIPWRDNRWKFRKEKSVHGDIPVADIIYDRVRFSTRQMQKFHEEILKQTLVKKSSTITSDKYEWEHHVEFGGKTYNIGLGGLHSQDDAVIYETNDEYVILDLDCTSMYPQSFVYNGLCPEHLDNEIFLEILNELLVERVKYKRLYKETKDDTYYKLQGAMKIALNSFFGLTNSKTFWLFDPKTTFTCTVNNQLLMMMLIEDFTLKEYKVISANTDGITVRIRREQLEPLREVYKEWEKMSGFTLEEVFYEKYIRRDVNNYIATIVGDKTKYKGDFKPQSQKPLSDGYEYPIVTEALCNYFLDNIPIEKTIKKCRDIYDFCFAQKCDKKFTNYLQYIEKKELHRYGKNLDKIYVTPKVEEKLIKEEIVQRNFRLFVSLPEVFETPELEKFEGYGDVYYRGYSLKKKKIGTSKRYVVIKDSEINRCWWIVDLLTGEKVGDSYKTKISTADILKELNSADDAVIKVEQVNNYVAGKFITLFNDYYNVDNFEDYRIDYDFYLDLAQKEIDKVEKQLKIKND